MSTTTAARLTATSAFSKGAFATSHWPNTIRPTTSSSPEDRDF